MTEQSAPSFKLRGLSISTNRDGLLFMLAYRFIPLDKRIIILDVMLDGFNFFTDTSKSQHNCVAQNSCGFGGTQNDNGSLDGFY
jgi:hypothetical protein